MRAIEKFILTAYSGCSRTESMWLILKSKGGYAQFTNFVEAEHADEYLTLFDETNKVRQVKKPTLFVLRKYVESIVQDYLRPESINYIIINSRLQADMMELLSDRIEQFNDPSGRVFDIIKLLQVEMVRLMAQDQLNRFLFSKFYKNWRANERGRAVASNRENAQQAVEKFLSQNPQRLSKAQSSRERPVYANGKVQPIIEQVDLLTTAFGNVHYRELEKLLDYQSWLNSLVVSVEALPLAFALSRVSSNHRGFPLIYVNGQFESLTGFKRTSVLGWQCKDFMQCPETEKDQTALLHDALKNRKVGSAILTNKHASGYLYHNLVCLKPVVDSKGVFVYVMALLFAVNLTDSADVEAKTQMAKGLMDLLPDNIIAERNEEEVPSCWEAGIERIAAATTGVVGLKAAAGRTGAQDEPSLRGRGGGTGRSSGGRRGGGHHRGRPGSSSRPSNKEASLRRAVGVEKRSSGGGGGGGPLLIGGSPSGEVDLYAGMARRK